MSAPAAPRPARSRIASARTGQRQPRGLRPESDGDGRHERAEQDEPARPDRRRGRRRLAGRCGRPLTDNRRQENGLRGQRGGKARGIAHRPRCRHPEKRRHHREHRRHGRPAKPLADPQLPQSFGERARIAVERVERGKQPQQGERRQRPEQRSPDGERPGFAEHEVRGLPEGHVDGIARRMRPVAAGIEVTQSEGEVHRVDVFERGGEKRQMAQQEHERQRGRGPPRPGAPPDGREHVPHGSPYTGSRRTPSLRLSHPVALQVEGDVAVADRLEVADDGVARGGFQRFCPSRRAPTRRGPPPRDGGRGTSGSRGR